MVGHLPSTVEVVFADIRDRRTVAAAMEKGRWVYHLAGNPNLWVRDRKEFESVNHHGTVHVLESALEAGAERILHTSTESILTRSNARGIIDENVVISESDTVGPYCLSKLRAEDAAMKLARAGWPVVVANPTMPVGPGDRGLSPPTRLIRDFCRGKLPALMDCTLNMIDVRDVATGLVRVLERGRPGQTLSPERRKPHTGRFPGHALGVLRSARAEVARTLRGGPGRGIHQRVLGRSHERTFSEGHGDRCPPGASDHALRCLAQSG